ncbi:unnamed protein product [Darwinula stevensoni]|uniref:Peptidase S1 domain-containing protein n=1 Tax=Darwinula stevensoni TaxID=69355 RepID=A0A7R8X349_9CRUS|nr:unnamed protein product [Darwinula stevensoni]CAG0884122.1 unnamed protein product [Darwinula stevensoni]
MIREAMSRGWHNKGRSIQQPQVAQGDHYWWQSSMPWSSSNQKFSSVHVGASYQSGTSSCPPGCRCVPRHQCQNIASGGTGGTVEQSCGQAGQGYVCCFDGQPPQQAVDPWPLQPPGQAIDPWPQPAPRPQPPQHQPISPGGKPVVQVPPVQAPEPGYQVPPPQLQPQPQPYQPSPQPQPQPYQPPAEPQPQPYQPSPQPQPQPYQPPPQPKPIPAPTPKPKPYQPSPKPQPQPQPYQPPPQPQPQPQPYQPPPQPQPQPLPYQPPPQPQPQPQPYQPPPQPKPKPYPAPAPKPKPYQPSPQPQPQPYQPSPQPQPQPYQPPPQPQPQPLPYQPPPQPQPQPLPYQPPPQPQPQPYQPPPQPKPKPYPAPAPKPKPYQPSPQPQPQPQPYQPPPQPQPQPYQPPAEPQPQPYQPQEQLQPQPYPAPSPQPKPHSKPSQPQPQLEPYPQPKPAPSPQTTLKPSYQSVELQPQPPLPIPSPQAYPSPQPVSGYQEQVAPKPSIVQSAPAPAPVQPPPAPQLLVEPTPDPWPQPTGSAKPVPVLPPIGGGLLVAVKTFKPRPASSFPQKPVYNQPSFQPSAPRIPSQPPQSAYQPPAPAPSYQAPAQSYQAPAPSYQAPAQSYQAPAPSYQAPAQPAYRPQPAPAPYQPYTGPLAESSPHPGCAAALLCVYENDCNATGYIKKTRDVLDEQNTFRVAVTPCRNTEQQFIGVCCRDPDYVDPWPGGMMMMGNFPKDKRSVPDPFSPLSSSPSEGEEKPKPVVVLQDLFALDAGIEKETLSEVDTLPEEAPPVDSLNIPAEAPSQYEDVPVEAPLQNVQEGEIKAEDPEVMVESAPLALERKQPANKHPKCGVEFDCVSFSHCDENGNIIADGSGIIDLRDTRRSNCNIEDGSPGICCRKPPAESCPQGHQCVIGDDGFCPKYPIFDGTGVIDPRIRPRSCLLDSTGALGVCCRPLPAIPVGCGVRHPEGIQVPSVEGDLLDRIKNPGILPANEARFAEFPWQAMLYRIKGDGVNEFVCGATLLNERFLLTAAHCVLKNHTLHAAAELKVRLGEWEINSSAEPIPYLDVPIAALYPHPEYQHGPEINDIAILEMAYPIAYNYHINRICLPNAKKTAQLKGLRCLATGWGKDAFDGKYQQVLKKVDVPLVEHKKCQSALQNTRLTKYFLLHPNFICAGGEENKDACTGDGGGPLMCPRAEDGRYILTGITSWGIGCGKKDVPGVYVRVDAFLPWIESITGVINRA